MPVSLIFVVTAVFVHCSSVGMVGQWLSLRLFRQPLAFGVGVVVEVEEEDLENHAVPEDNVDEDRELVEAVLHEEILADVCG